MSFSALCLTLGCVVSISSVSKEKLHKSGFICKLNRHCGSQERVSDNVSIKLSENKVL